MGYIPGTTLQPAALGTPPTKELSNAPLPNDVQLFSRGRLHGDEVLVQLADLTPHSQHLPPTSPSQRSVSVSRAPVCGEPLEPAVLRFGIQLLSWRLVRDQ